MLGIDLFVCSIVSSWMIHLTLLTNLSGVIKYRPMDSELAHSTGQPLTLETPSLMQKDFTLFPPLRLRRPISPKLNFLMGEELTTSAKSLNSSDCSYRYRLNLTRTDSGDGTCTANVTGPYYNRECSIYSNISTHAVVPPVRSARLTTQGTRSILYGRVEVVAKVPKGDWLWPAIWWVFRGSSVADC